MVNERQPSTITTTITIKLNLTSFLRLLIVLNLIESLFALTLTDYGFDQSIAYKFLPPGERRQLQRQMLNLLGLDHRPKPKKKDIFSSFYLRDLYQSYFDEDTANLIDGHYHPIVIEGEILSKPSISAINESDVIVSFVNQYNRSVKHSKHGKDRKFWFDTSEISPESNVISAELRLFRNHTGFQKDSFEIYKLHIYSISNEHEMPTSRLVASKVITHERGWLMFNVTGAIQDWIIYPEHNHGLYLAIYSSSTGKELEPKDIGIIGGGRGARDKQPFILAFFKSQSNSLHRTKRDAKKSQYSEVSTYDTYGEFNPYFDRRYTSGRSCQKKSLYVSFKDLGWQDWIIAPDGYAAFFCDGECSFPLNAHMNATNHAIVQTLVHLMNPSSVPKPCCAPTKLSSIMVLYFDDNSNVILKKYKNMVVKSCGCH